MGARGDEGSRGWGWGVWSVECGVWIVRVAMGCGGMREDEGVGEGAAKDDREVVRTLSRGFVLERSVLCHKSCEKCLMS